MLWKGSQVPQEEDEEAVTKKAIKELEIFVSQIFYNFFLFISLFQLLYFTTFFLYFFYPRHLPTPTPTTYDLYPRPTTFSNTPCEQSLRSTFFVFRGKWGLIIYSMGQENKVCSSRIGKRKRSFLFKVWLVQLVREVKHWPVTELKCLMIRTYHAEANQNTTNTKILYF